MCVSLWVPRAVSSTSEAAVFLQAGGEAAAASLSLTFTEFALLFIYWLDVRSEPATLQSDLSHISSPNLILLCVMDASAKLHINASATIEAGLEVEQPKSILI